MDNKIYIGIDPGKTGAIAYISNQDVAINDFCDFKKIELLNFYSQSLPSDSIKVAIEKATARPQQGVVSVFNFGVSYGWWLGALEYQNLKYTVARPQEWRKEFFSSGQKLNYRARKKASLEKARELFPNIAEFFLRRVKDDGRAEALLIAEWLRRCDQVLM